MERITKGSEMSRKRARQIANEIDASITPEVIDAAIERAASHVTGKGIDVAIKPREKFSPRSCSMCEALRPAGTNFSKCYCTRESVRYCRCEYCNNTWTQFFNNDTIRIVRSDQKLVTQETGTPSLVNGISSISVSTD